MTISLEMEDLFDQIHKRIGDEQQLEIQTSVLTYEGRQYVVRWRRAVANGLLSGECMVVGYSLQEALRRVLDFEEQIEDANPAPTNEG